MNLSKQVYLSISILFFVLLFMIHVIIFNFQYENLLYQYTDRAIEYAKMIEHSFQSHENTGEKDMLSKLLKNGLFKRIRIQANNGKTILDSHIGDLKSDVPEWFISHYKNTVMVELELSRSNQQSVGTLKLEISDLIFYKQLWELYKSQFVIIVSIFLIGILALFFVMLFLFRPIRDIFLDATRLEKKEFKLEKKHYLAKDIQLIHESLIFLQNRTLQLFKEHNSLNEMLRNKMYKDPITNLGNRRFFNRQFEHLLSATEAGCGGALLLLRVVDIKEYKEKWGIHAGEELLRYLAILLTKFKRQYQVYLVAHLGMADFALIILNCNKDHVQRLCEDIFDRVKQLGDYEGVKSVISLNVGVSFFGENTFAQTALTSADSALSKSIKKGPNTWFIGEELNQFMLHKIKDWTGFIQQKIQDKDIFLQYQAVFFYEENATILFHSEALARMTGMNKEIFFAGIFLPFVSQLQMGIELDKIVVSMVIDRIKDTPDGYQRYGVNITEASLSSKEFLTWLLETLKHLGEGKKRITFEFPEAWVRNDFEAAMRFADQMQLIDVQVGLDHFGSGFTSLGYLDLLPIEFVKIDGSYIRHIEEKPEVQVIIRSFVEIAHGLNITVFATCVETEEEREVLQKLGVDGIQGYFVGQPS